MKVTRGLPAAVAAAGIAALPAPAAQAAPCSPAVTTSLSVRDTRAGAGLYATHPLKVALMVNGRAEPATPTAAGARVVGTEDDGFSVVADRPGPFTVTATSSGQEPGGESCDASASARLSARAPAPTRLTGLKRPPRRFKARGQIPRFTFTLPIGASGGLSPITVRARVTGKQRFPGRRAKRKARTFYPRLNEAAALPPSFPARGACRDLLCSSGVTVEIRKRGGSNQSSSERFAPAGLAVSIQVPFGRAYGVEVEALQSGRRVARLRAAGRCRVRPGLSAAQITCQVKRLSRKR